MKKSTKRLIVLFLSFALLFSSLAIAIAADNGKTADSGKKTINVWLIAGQSNASGYGKISEYPSERAESAALDNGITNVLYYGRGEATNYDDFVPVTFGLGKGYSESGAEIGIATALANSGEMHAVIKYAQGDTQLTAVNVNSSTNVSTWTSPSYIAAHSDIEFEGDKIGDLYNGFMNTVKEGLDKLVEDGYTPVVRGVWWMQGERDSNLGSMTEAIYSEALKAFISDVRADVGLMSGADCSELPFVYGRVYLNPDHTPSSKTGLAAVQAAQDAVNADTSLKNVSMIDTRSELVDLNTATSAEPVQQDKWHYDAVTQQRIGEAFIRKVNLLTPEFKDTKGVYILNNEQALYSTTVNYVTGTTCKVSFGSYELFSISDSGLKMFATENTGIYASGDYTVYVCVNPTQNMTVVEVKLPGGGILRRGAYGKNSGGAFVTSVNGEARFGGAELSYANLVLNEYELVTTEPTETGFGANVYNLMNSFSDATSTRLFAWTAKADFVNSRTMAVKYRIKGTDAWTAVDAYKLDEPTEYAPEDYYKADVSGLVANSEYEYKIGIKDSSDEVNEWSKSYYFTTASGNEKEFTFIAVGDTQGITWGGTEVANKGFMYTKSAFDEAFEEVSDPAFILHTGDVVEEGLVEEQWNLYFKALGEAGASIPHFAAIGNHDANLYSNDRNLYFGMHFNHPDNGGADELDSTVVANVQENWTKMLLEYADETFYSYNYGDAHFIVYNSGAYMSEDEMMMKAQRAWLRNDLEANKDAKWTIVLAHQASYHRYGGAYDRDFLTDLLEGFDVDLVIQGHSHLVTRSYPMKNGEIVTKENPDLIKQGTGTVYMLIGATALNHDRITDYPVMENQAVAISNVGTQPSYTVFNVTEDYIKVAVKQVNGLVLDEFTIVASEEEEEEKTDGKLVYSENFNRFFTYNEIATTDIWETENSGKYQNATAPYFKGGKLTFKSTNSIQFNWVEFIGGTNNYSKLDTYVFEFDATVTNWGSNSSDNTEVLYIAPGGYYNQIAMMNKNGTMQVGGTTNHPCTYTAEETFHIVIEWIGNTIYTTVTDSTGKVITGSRSYDYYTEVATTPLLQTLVIRCEDGAAAIDNFKFTRLTPVTVDGYGTIPSDKADESKYPIAIFQGGEFKAVYGENQFNEAMSYVRSTLVPNKDIEMSAAPAPAQILLRGNVYSTANDQNLGQTVGTIDVNLNGYTVTQTYGSSHFFYLRTKTYSKYAQKITLNVYNGNLVLSGYLFGVGAQQNNSSMASEYAILKDADATFTNVNISLVRGKGWGTANIFEDQSGTNYSEDKTVNFNITFNDCVFDYTRATASQVFFNMNHTKSTVNAIQLKINGGKLMLSKPASDTAIYSLNSESSITFGKGSDGKYLELTVPSGNCGVLTADSLYLDSKITTAGSDGQAADFGKLTEADMKATYTLRDATSKDVYVEGYGTIPEAYSDATAYPIVLFQDGQFKQAFAKDKFTDALKAARALVPHQDIEMSAAPKPAMVLLRGNVTATANDQNLGQAVGVIDVNLNGFTVTQTDNTQLFFARTKTYSTKAQTVTLNVYNGNIVLVGHLLAIGTQTNGTYKQYKDASISFTNVKITSPANTGLESCLIHHTSQGSLPTTLSVNYNIKFNDCTFDISGITNGTAIFNFNSPQTTAPTAVTAEINGGKIILGQGSKDATVYKLNSVSNITFGKGSDGKYIEITAPKNSSISALTNTEFYVGAPITASGSAGEKAEYFSSAIGSTQQTYTLAPNVYVEGYGTIPAAYTDAKAYPIVIFQDGKFKQAFAKDKFIEALAAARGLVPSANIEMSAAPKPAQMLLRGDVTATANDQNLGSAVGVIDINLNGFTVTQTDSTQLFYMRTKTYSANEQTVTLNVYNGNIILKSYLLALGTQSNGAYDQYKSANINFTNVNITTLTGTSRDTFLAHHTNGSLPITANVNYSIKFNDCTFDLSGMSSLGTVFNFNGTSATAPAAVQAEINGGKIILGQGSYGTNLYSLNAYSNVALGKGSDGKYLTVVAPTDKAPAMAANDILSVKLDNNGNAKSESFVLVNIGEERGTVLYRLTPKAVTEQSFAPMASITLGSELTFNIYVPMNANLTALQLDGMTLDLSTLTVKDGYYLVTVDLAAKEAAKEIKLVATLTVDGKAMRGTFTFSTVKYAEKVLADTDIATTEKTLIKDVLSYIRAAYAYFGTEDAVAMAKIDALLGKDYDEAQAPVMNGSAEKPTLGISAVTYNLTAQPALRFYLADGFTAADFTFSIKGNTVAATEGSDKNGSYVEVKLYAYELAETVDYTVNGESDSCHIKSYYEWAKDQNNEKLVTLVERFAKYCESAAAYRKSVTK